MKAYGRQRQHPGNYQNSPLQREHVMWWEVEYKKVKSKKSARQENENIIKKEVEEHMNIENNKIDNVNEKIYTTEEYEQLYTMLMEKSPSFADLIKMHLQGEPFHYGQSVGNRIRNMSLCEYLKIRTPEEYKVLFGVPFGETPTSIATKNSVVLEILKWRWTIKK